ncbi:uncharacterized protein CMU_024160 [Cryptosporidium muris RN66]|uniref:Uncharacterized protein n=1 Tax=Cryptosporidium muris (strain RN66) TaxID=441375 RepID=B6AC58_CRYMR|nr:uncharacterized protein CMU_024160 [Cryptosporidium muris RN66]EEA05411.1 hypothetical protein, conserved [Cryptosporidium muris RN66]|eukprot:XP_002139760.1 hypothetical protein [Cryptosporidium muris RN66]
MTDAEDPSNTLMTYVAVSLHEAFEEFQNEATTTLRIASDETIERTLEKYVRTIRDIFGDNFNRIGWIFDDQSQIDSSMDIFYFSAYIYELFYSVYYSQPDEFSLNLFKWYLKYGLYDCSSKIISSLTQAADEYLEGNENLQVDNHFGSESPTKICYGSNDSVETRLTNLLIRTLLLGELGIFTSTLRNIFPEDHNVVALCHLLTINDLKYKCPKTKLSSDLLSLKNQLPPLVRPCIDAFTGDGHIIQQVAKSWLEAFVFSTVYVNGISINNFSEFLDVYMEFRKEVSDNQTNIESTKSIDCKKKASMINYQPENVLQHELGALYLLSKDITSFVQHIYNSPDFYGPFLATHIIDPLYYEGLLEDLKLEMSSIKLRCRVIMDYSIWLIETDICDPAIYLQECCECDELSEDVQNALLKLSNKVPLLADQVTTEFDLDDDQCSVVPAVLCEQCQIYDLCINWSSDESITTFLKLIRIFIPEIIHNQDLQIRLKRHILIDRLTQINILYSNPNFFSDMKELVLYSLYLERLILLMELCILETSNSPSLSKFQGASWSLIESSLNIPLSYILIIDQDGKYKFQLPEASKQESLSIQESLKQNNPSNLSTYSGNESKFILFFFTQKGIIKSLFYFFPEIISSPENPSLPPYFSSIYLFGQEIFPILRNLINLPWDRKLETWIFNIQSESNACNFFACNTCTPVVSKSFRLNTDKAFNFSNLRTETRKSNLIPSDYVILIQESINKLFGINTEQIPAILISVYCYYCLFCLSNTEIKKISPTYMVNKFNYNWLDVKFASLVKDISHPLIRNFDYIGSLTSSISEKLYDAKII